MWIYQAYQACDQCQKSLYFVQIEGLLSLKISVSFEGSSLFTHLSAGWCWKLPGRGTLLGYFFGLSKERGDSQLVQHLFQKSSLGGVFFLKPFLHPRNCETMIQLRQSYFFQLDGSSTKSPLLSEVLKFDLWSYAFSKFIQEFYHRNSSTRGFSFKKADVHVHVFYDWSIITILQYLKSHLKANVWKSSFFLRCMVGLQK